MRLIDADALERRVYTGWLNGELSNSEWIDFREWLKDEPTVEPASPWHRVEEPPMVGQNVLTMDVNEDMETATYDGKDFEDAYGFYVEDVLYWMPLPEPPKEEV